jgi:hypothetical protein
MIPEAPVQPVYDEDPLRNESDLDILNDSFIKGSEFSLPSHGQEPRFSRAIT